MHQKYLIFICIYLLSFTSCLKTDLQISTIESNNITVNGVLSNVLEIQKINLKKNSSIVSTNSSFINDATIYINYQNNIYNFQYSSNGDYLSNEPIKIESGIKYSLSIVHNSISIESQSEMPYPITINNLDSTQTGIQIDITSPIQQYFVFKLYDASIDPINNDTIWSEIITNQDVFQVQGIPNDTIQIYNSDNNRIGSTTNLIKISLYPLTKKVADYLILLSEYRKHQSTTNQYKNPPMYYSNDVYGLVYGSPITSIIHSF